MVKHRLDFSPEFITHLRLMGIRGAAPGTHVVDSETTFEAPIALHNAFVFHTPITIGAFTYLGERTHIAQARIGRYCSIAKDVQIGLLRHPTDWLTSAALAFMPFPAFEEPLMDADPMWQRTLPVQPFEDEFATTTIGNDVWIGNGACIREGISVGDGAIIGAMTMVTKDVPPYAIVVGNPGRVIRMRFDDATIERMLAVQWWRYNLLDLNLDLTDPLRALDAIAELAPAPFLPDTINLVAEHRAFRKAQRRMQQAEIA
jgi:virginiamycin A acetyltransferase